jgi:hypothetical protein
MSYDTRKYVLMVAASASLSVVGCDSDGSAVDRNFLGIGRAIIEDFGRPVRIVINGTVVSDFETVVQTESVPVRAGVPFNVTTSPLAAPDCQRPALSTVAVDERTAVVSVQDSTFSGPCEFVLASQERTDVVVLTELGNGEVVIRGSAMSEGAAGPPLPDVDLRFPIVVTE